MLLYVTEKWKCAIDRNEFVGALFLDLSKAFNCVNQIMLFYFLSYPTLASEANHFNGFKIIWTEDVNVQ